MRRLVFILSFIACSKAYAQESIYDRCAAAVEQGNAELVAELATSIRRFNSHPIQQLELAELCVSFAEEKQVSFDSGTGRFVDAAQLEQQRQSQGEAYEQRRIAEEERRLAREAREAAVAAAAILNEFLVTGGVYLACLALYDRDEVMAMTNTNCIQSFRAYGHPQLESFSIE